MTTTAGAPARLEEIARRLGALPRHKQDEFVAWLASRDIGVLSLPIVAQPRPERVPLSHAQRSMWLLDQLHPGGSEYNVPRVFTLSGALDQAALAAALAGLVARHEVLRTTFAAEDGEPFQVIGPPPAVDLDPVDLTSLPADQRRARARELADAEAGRPFDLARGPLFRARLLRLDRRAHWLLLTSHHIVMDEWSDEVLAGELVELYDAHRRGRAPALAPLPIQYADHAVWQRRWLDDRVLAGQLAHWKQQLVADADPTVLPRDFPLPAEPTRAAASHRFRLDGQLTSRMRELAARGNTTLFTALLAAFHLLLHRTGGRREIRTGVPIANRHRRELEGLIGLFANTQVLSSSPRGAMTFAEHLEQVRRATVSAQANQDLPFERLVEELQPERSASHTPLFQVMFSWHRGMADKAGAPGELTIGQESVHDRTAKFDLVLHMTDGDDGVGGELLYRSELFAPGTIAALAARLVRLAAAAVERPDRPMAELDWLEPGERDRIARRWNDTDAPRPPLPLHRWIEARALEAPGAPAVRGEDELLTRGELDERAARVAGLLASRGLGVEDRIGLCVPRSPDLVAGMLGILKCGAAYVPIDPRTPRARLREILADAGVTHVVARPADAPLLEGAATVVAIHDDALAAASPLAGVDVPPGAAAYVLYTSGSTGGPKGVVVPHGAIISYVAGLLDRLALPPAVSMALVSTPTADLGNTVLFGALCSGGLLHIVSEERCFDADGMAAYMRRHPVAVMKITPSHLGGLLQASRPADVLPLHTLVLGGEVAPAGLLAHVRRHGGCRIVNHYGPTETTVGVLTHDAGAGGEQDAGTSLPLGRPLPRARAYVLDADLAPVPPGVLGEIYIGGDGVARGYLGRPGATADRFVPDRFRPGGGRLYRTGDRARYLADGSIEFAGRTDDQIKIRGHRVEPGEIRQALLDSGAAADAHVLLRETSTGPRLIAYMIAADGVGPDQAAVRRELERRLPEHMVPADLVFLEAFPLTANGKLDRRALPEPGATRAAVVAPRSEVEAILAEVWREVLQRDQVGVEDNFFSAGGDSLLAFQVVARLRRSGVNVTIPQMFEHQTIAALARVARREAPDGEPEQARPEGEVIPTPIQRWFLDRDLARPHHFNQSVLLELRESLAAETLAAALARLVDHHDALRMQFRRADGAWHQSYGPAPEPARLLEVIDHRGVADADAALADAAARAQRELDLGEGPLLRAVLFERGTPRGDRLLLVAHHLVVDGMSWRILLEDLASIHRSLAAGEEPVLPPRTSSFQAWSAALSAHAHSGARRGEIETWRAISAGGDGLPCEGDEAGNSEGACRVAAASLDVDETAALLGRAPAAYRTRIDDLLLTALALTLCEWTGQDSALVALEGHGREPLFDRLDVSRTVGWFTAAHPVRLTPAPGDLGRSIASVKEALRRIPDRGIGHGVLRHLAGEDLGPSPRLTFNYLGQFDQVFDERGPFRPAPEPAGDERDAGAPRDRWFDVIALVEGHRLHVDWQYSPALHAPELVERLAARYVEHLRALIDHCAEPRGVTPSDFPLVALEPAELDALPVPVASLEEVYPLTPTQEGILFHCLLAPADGLYVTQRLIDIDAEVALDSLRAAWQEVAAAHDALRTGFAFEQLSRPVQVVWRAVDVPFEVVDLRDLDPDRQATERERLLADDRRRGFDLARPPLMRATLLRLSGTRHQLVWTEHHLLLDGWSCWRVLSEVLARYRAHAAGAPLPVRPASIRPYLAWLASLDPAASEAFWRGQLGDIDGPTLLAQHLGGDAEDGHARQELELSAEASARLRRFAEEHALTMNTLVQGALVLVVGLHTGRRDVVVGVTVSGRSAALPGVDEMVGLFIQTLPLRVPIDGQQRVASWLRDLMARNAAMREHEHTPLVRAQAAAGIRGAALFDTLLVFENYPIDGGLGPAAGELGVGAVAAFERTNYPLALEVAPGERLLLQLDHDLRAVGRAAARELVGRLGRTLEALAAAGDARLDDLPWLDPPERDALAAWNMTARPVPDAVGVHALFEEQAARAPDAIAVVDRDRSITYGELDARADSLAWRLVDDGVGPESIVGVSVDRSIEMIVGLLAVLKAGAAYLPLDPDFPPVRLAHMTADARPAVVLVGADGSEVGWPGGVPVRIIGPEAAAPDPRGRPPVRTRPEQLAYCIYTSGSTGMPKGVAVTHGSLLNFVATMTEHLAVDRDDAVLALTSLSFDIAGLELWLPLACGARVVIAEREEAADAERLFRRLEEGSVTVVQATPTTWRTMDRGPRRVVGGRARVLCGGEALAPDLAAQLSRRARLFNVYGPTETTIWSSIHRIDADRPDPSIGGPLANTSLHVLDAALRPVPVGVAGELYIGGLGLARGYLGRPGATAARFVPDPFGSTPGARMYRTGDLARRRADGTIDCLGRTDDQVKLRGHRIELGEIEARLRVHPRVTGAVAAVRGTGAEAQLVAYLVAGDVDRAGLEAELAAALRAELPDAMVPQRWVHLDALPLTANGKLDRKALPSPSAPPRAPHVAPRDPVERDLAALWSRALGGAEVGVHDDFFERGGDSVLVLQIVAGARARGIPLSPRDLFEYPTIEGLAAAARARGGDRAQELPWPAGWPAPDDGLDAMAESRLIDLGAVDPATLGRALAAVVAHHDALRLRARRDGASWRLSIGTAPASVRVRHHVVVAAGADGAADAAGRAHDRAREALRLDGGPLVRATILPAADRDRVLVTAHALAVDAASWPVLIEDLRSAYRAVADGRPPQLPAAASFFSLLASGGARVGAISAGRSRPRRRVEAELDETSSAVLLDVVPRRHRAALDAVLLASLAGPLCRAGEPCAVALDSAARAAGRIVGRCAGVIPVLLRPAGDAFEAIDAIEDQLRAPPDLRPDVLVRYLGELGPDEQRIAPHDPHALVVTAWSCRGRLRLAVEVDADRAAADGALADEILVELRRMLGALAEAPPRAPRAHDFSHVALDDGELADLLEDMS